MNFKKKLYEKAVENLNSATKLSNELNTTLVPEYATFFINEVSRLLSKKDLINIAITQLGYQKTIKKESFFYNINDTDIITTKIWYKKFFGEEGIEIFNEIIEKQEDGLYLLLNNNNQWKEDNHRYFPNDEDRKWFLNQFIIELENYNKEYILIENRNLNEILKLIN